MKIIGNLETNSFFITLGWHIKLDKNSQKLHVICYILFIIFIFIRIDYT